MVYIFEIIAGRWHVYSAASVKAGAVRIDRAGELEKKAFNDFIKQKKNLIYKTFKL